MLFDGTICIGLLYVLGGTHMDILYYRKTYSGKMSKSWSLSFNWEIYVVLDFAGEAFVEKHSAHKEKCSLEIWSIINKKQLV